MHRPMFWALMLSVMGLGCWSQRKPPFAHSPVLLHYKPTLSDSATILAEMQARRGPEKPPMPTNGSEESAIEPVKAANPPTGENLPSSAGEALPPLTEPFSQHRQPRPIIRASGQSSGTAKIDGSKERAATNHLPDVLPPPPNSGVEPVNAPTQSATELPPPESAKDSVPVVELPEGLSITVEGESTTGTTTEPTHMKPIEPTPPHAGQPIVMSGSQARKSVAGSYGHDPDRRWLQGVLERHHRGYYCLRYCDPSVEDDFGGKVRLVEDDRLKQFRDGDVIAVFGQISEHAEVAPPYRIEDIWLVRPR